VTDYGYSPELVAPVVGLGRIRFRRWWIAVAGLVIRLQARTFRVPAGVVIRKVRFPGYLGACLSAWIVEPAGLEGPVPCILYFHGGAFIFPVQTMMLRNAACYARELGVRVMIPEYRLAPRHPFPVPVEDCYAALDWAARDSSTLGLDHRCFIVLGESAGGCIAAAVALMARDRNGPPLLFQMLLYPVTDRSQQGESLRTYPDGLWSTEANRQMWRLYLRESDNGAEAYASPLAAEDLHGLPPAYVEVAEYDGLRSEGLAYADRLAASGCPVTTEIVRGAFHGYDLQHRSPLVKRMLARRCEVFRLALARAQDVPDVRDPTPCRIPS